MRRLAGLSINLKIYFCGGNAAIFVFPATCAAEKHLVSEKLLNKRFFKGTGVVLAEHNNRLPPVADKRRALWRRGQRKFALQANIFFGYRKSRECSQKSLIFASGIPAKSVSKNRHTPLRECRSQKSEIFDCTLSPPIPPQCP